MVGMKVVVRILCAVALLVQCAMCGMDSNHVKAVQNMLRSYAKLGYFVDYHLGMLGKYETFELKHNYIADPELRGFIRPLYCPAATMLACGEAEVPVEFCLQLLDRVKVFVEASREHIDGPRTCRVDATPEPSSSTVASPRTSVRTAFSKQVASSRQRTAVSIEPVVGFEQELTAEQQEVKKLLEKRPTPERDVLVEERLKVLEIQFEILATKQHDVVDKSLKYPDLRTWSTNELRELGEKVVLLGKEEKALQKKEQQACAELVVNEEDARRRQIQRSVATVAVLVQLPNARDLAKQWIKEQKTSPHFVDIATKCYPEQFIVCGQKIREAHPDERDAAVLKCFETIHKYNTFRGLAEAIV